MNTFTRIAVAVCVVAACCWSPTRAVLVCKTAGPVCATCTTIGNCTAANSTVVEIDACHNGQVCSMVSGAPKCVASNATLCACEPFTVSCDAYDTLSVTVCVTPDVPPVNYAPQIVQTCTPDQPCTGGRCVAPTPPPPTNTTTTSTTTTTTTTPTTTTTTTPTTTTTTTTPTTTTSTTPTTTTTKPTTCSLSNVNKRYHHETDCKKYYTCREVTRGTYGYVVSTCPLTYLFSRTNLYCDLPSKVTC